MNLRPGDNVLYLPTQETGIVSTVGKSESMVRFYRKGIGYNPTGQSARNENLVLVKGGLETPGEEYPRARREEGLEELK